MDLLMCDPSELAGSMIKSSKFTRTGEIVLNTTNGFYVITPAGDLLTDRSTISVDRRDCEKPHEMVVGGDVTTEHVIHAAHMCMRSGEFLVHDVITFIMRTANVDSVAATLSLAREVSCGLVKLVDKHHGTITASGADCVVRRLGLKK